MENTAIGATKKKAMFISEAHERFYFEKLGKQSECVPVYLLPDVIYAGLGKWVRRHGSVTSVE